MNQYAKFAALYGAGGAAIGHFAAQSWQKGALIGAAVGLYLAYQDEVQRNQTIARAVATARAQKVA